MDSREEAQDAQKGDITKNLGFTRWVSASVHPVFSSFCVFCAFWRLSITVIGLLRDEGGEIQQRHALAWVFRVGSDGKIQDSDARILLLEIRYSVNDRGDVAARFVDLQSR